MQPHNVNCGRSCDMRNGDVTRIRTIYKSIRIIHFSLLLKFLYLLNFRAFKIIFINCFWFFWKAQVTNIIFVCLLQQHKIETANLLNNLKQKDEKIREERKRQLGMLNEKRERLHNAGKTPRTTPAPAAASKRKS